MAGPGMRPFKLAALRPRADHLADVTMSDGFALEPLFVVKLQDFDISPIVVMPHSGSASRVTPRGDLCAYHYCNSSRYLAPLRRGFSLQERRARSQAYSRS
jgi:hypothetical protein